MKTKERKDRIEVVDGHLYGKIDAIRQVSGESISRVTRRLLTERLTQLESQANHGSGSGAGNDAGKVADAPIPGHSNSAA